MNSIEVAFSATGGSYSLGFWDSDLYENQVLLHCLVATLVKIDNSGLFTPSLSRQWQISNNGKKWEFEFALYKDESGRIISPEIYGQSLIETLKRLKEKGENGWYQKLKGWKNLDQSSMTIDGIATTETSLVFDFEESPGNLLNYLQMAYFGYWPEENRNWQPGGKFISSGPYSIEEFTPKRVTLSLRPNDRNGLEPSGAQKVILSLRNVSIEEFHRDKIIYFSSTSIPEEILSSSSHSVALPPDFLSTMILSPLAGNFFDDANYRRSFGQALISEIQKGSLPPNHIRVSKFYGIPNSPLDDQEIQFAQTKHYDRKLRISAPRNWAPGMKNFVVDATKSFLDRYDIPYEFMTPDLKSPAGRQRYLENQFYDIRFTGVSSGSEYMNDVVEMMFCSTLGVSFPDPDNKVCELIEHYSENSKDTNYSDRLNHAVEESGFVFPYSRFYQMILFSEGFKLKKYPTGAHFIEFENLEFQD